MQFLRRHGDGWHWEPSGAARRLGFKGAALGIDEAAAALKAAELNLAYQRRRDEECGASYEGSFRQLRDLYYQSREWKRLAPESQRDYRRHIDKTIIPHFGAEQVADVDAEIVGALHGEFAERPYAGNHCLRVLGTLFRCALQHPSHFDLGGVNPCKAIVAYGVKEGVQPRERTWTDEEVAAFDAVADGELRMARLLYSYTGQRTVDVLAMKDTDYKVDAAGRWLHVAQQKTGKRLWIYCHADLWPAIEAHVERHRISGNRKGFFNTPKIGAPLIQNTRGEAFNRRVFVMRWDRRAVKAGIVTLAEGEGERRSRENPTRHDLRRTATTLLAEAGCNEEQISSITGLSIAMIRRQVYNVRSKAHSKAGIQKLEEYRK